jgi:hypothetical protein
MPVNACRDSFVFTAHRKQSAQVDESTISMPSRASEQYTAACERNTYDILGLATFPTPPASCGWDPTGVIWKTFAKFFDFTMLSMISQADTNVSLKRTILDPLFSSSRQASSLRSPTSSCLTCFHMVIAIMTFFLTSPPKMSKRSMLFCGEPTLRLSDILCKYTMPAIAETLYLNFKYYFTARGTTW